MGSSLPGPLMTGPAPAMSGPRTIEEWSVMGKPITTEIAVAYTHCPRKAFLLLNAASPPPPHEYDSLCRDRGKAHRERYAYQLSRDGHEVANCDRKGLDSGHRYLVGVDLRASDLSASCDVLVRLDHESSPKGHFYSPQVFAGTYSVTDEHKFALSFLGHVLGMIQGNPPDYGRITTLDGVSHDVALVDRYRETASVLADVRKLADRDATPPPVILNRHCPLCHFRTECRTKAEADDDLSLLDRMTPKAIRRYHKKGIFTVTQLSYLFRPRRRRRGTGACPAFKLELQALAIRTGKIYLQTPPSVVRKPVELFLDIEGVPDEHYHYLIGIVVRRGDECTVHSLWADSMADEPRIWGDATNNPGCSRRCADYPLRELRAETISVGYLSVRACQNTTKRINSPCCSARVMLALA